MLGTLLTIVTTPLRAATAPIKIISNISEGESTGDIVTDAIRYTVLGTEEQEVMDGFLDFSND